MIDLSWYDKPFNSSPKTGGEAGYRQGSCDAINASRFKPRVPKRETILWEAEEIYNWHGQEALNFVDTYFYSWHKTIEMRNSL